MKPFEPINDNPFLSSRQQPSWWLRDATQEELETHRRLTKQLTELEKRPPERK